MNSNNRQVIPDWGTSGKALKSSPAQISPLDAHQCQCCSPNCEWYKEKDVREASKDVQQTKPT